MKKTSLALYISRGAVIAALYTALSYLTQSLQIAFFQIRPAEALCVLAMFLPEAVPALFIGCIISNAISGCVALDIIFGSIATLLGAIGARLLARLPYRLRFCATVPTVIANALIIPPILVFAYGSKDAYWFLFSSVFIGELVSAGILGSILYYTLSKTKLFGK